MLLKFERIEAVSDPMRTHECPKAYLYLLGAVDDRLRKSKDGLHRHRESGTICVLELLVRWRVRRVIGGANAKPFVCTIV